jgi:hypothetical protein
MKGSPDCATHRHCSIQLERLTFAARPAFAGATWKRGIMDVCCYYWGLPFAFMVVRNGVFEEGVHRDAQWACTMPCSLVAWAYDRALEELFQSLEADIIRGCTAVVNGAEGR